MKKIIPLILVVIVVVGVGLGVHYFIGWDVVIGKITGDKIETTCKVSYEFDGVQVLEVKKGEMFSLETIPSKVGHTFKGLYDAPAGGNQIVSPTGVSIATFSIDKDIVLYAQWDAITYMVNFVDGNSLVTQYEVQYGETLISLPDAPIKQGRVFDCWSTKVEGKDKIIADQNGFHVGSNVVDENNFQLAYNIYIDANYTLETYDVNFYYSESSNDFVTKKIAYGTNISEILITNNAGTETVIKWSKNRNDTAGTAIFNDVITRPMNLYAQAWGYNLTIDYNHSLIENTKALLPKGEVIQQPEMSLPTGIRLVGWYNNDNLISFPFSLDSNTTIKAKYEAKVTFDFGVLNKPDVVITIEPGTIVTASEITDILPEGVRLKGWLEGVSQKTFPRMVTEDSVFVAKYEAQVNYITNGANEPNKTSWVEVGTRIPIYNVTFSKFYEFKGWEYAGNIINEMPICPLNSVTLYAKVEDVQIPPTYISTKSLSCKLDNGYDYTQPATDTDPKFLHDHFEFGKFRVTNTIVSGNSLTMKKGAASSINFNINYDTDNLPIAGSCTHSGVCDDPYNKLYEMPYNTGSQKVGYGLIVATITYKDGTPQERIIIKDAFKEKSAGSIVTIVDGSLLKSDCTIKISMVYELKQWAPGFLNISGAYYRNWRINQTFYVDVE